ncbi:hypothetical protein QJS04_geneDACA018292 [Acorus gramineus]|uniref:Uncharacterized protein n=1 Tax=Acorus gramineus TaxID=55184 RepID=A0AAV9BB47_ACOGR|nr:hypothetical protein QJS04_geneDACA018292 [Acorus gramineus]
MGVDPLIYTRKMGKPWQSGQTTKGLVREEQREESLNMPSSDSEAMDVVKAFHMKEGVGEPSYAQN